MTILFTEPSFVPVSGNSVVYPGAKLYFYETGTSTLQNTYSEYTLTTAHANPVVADADGRFAPIYLDPGLEDYKVVLKDSSDVTIWTVDPYSAVKNTTALATMSALLSASTALSTVSINGYHTEGDGGGGEFYWDASQDKANHNGGTIIDPDITFPTDWTNQTQLATWFTAGSGTGCWMRVIKNATQFYAAEFGAKGDGSTDNYQSINAIISAVPERVSISTNIGGGPWEYSGAYVINFAASETTYKHGTKLVVPYTKNIIFATDAPGAAVLQYTGSSYYGVEFQPGNISKTIGIRNLSIKDGGVVVVGTQGGNISFEDFYIYNSPNYGLLFVDGGDYTDGPSGDYTTPGSFSATSSGVNTVFVTMKKVQFFYCEKGMGVLSTTVLLFNCYKPRFYGCTNASLTISATGLIFEEPEFLGVENYTTAPYIHFPLDNALAPASHIFFNGGRFGSEDITVTQYSPNRTYKPPTSYILFGEYGTYSARATVSSNVEFRNFICEADNSTPKETDHLVFLNGDVRYLRFENCSFTQFQEELVKEQAFADAGVSASNCVFSNNVKDPTSLGGYFSDGGQGWRIDEDRIELTAADSPEISVSVASDTFVDGDVSIDASGTNDRITMASHPFVSSQNIRLTTTGTLPAGLATATDYYVKKIDANTIELYSNSSLSSIVSITSASGGGTHTITAQGTTGSGATASVAALSTDSRGSITITTGTSSSTGNFATLGFSRNFSKTPSVMFMPANVAAAGKSISVANRSQYGVTLRINATPADSTAYIFDYIVVG